MLATESDLPSQENEPAKIEVLTVSDASSSELSEAHEKKSPEDSLPEVCLPSGVTCKGL